MSPDLKKSPKPGFGCSVLVLAGLLASVAAYAGGFLVGTRLF